MDREIVKELIQADLNPKQVKSELLKILETEEREKMLASFEELKLKLGGEGASSNAADVIDKLLASKSEIKN